MEQLSYHLLRGVNSKYAYSKTVHAENHDKTLEGSLEYYYGDVSEFLPNQDPDEWVFIVVQDGKVVTRVFNNTLEEFQNKVELDMHKTLAAGIILFTQYTLRLHGIY